MPVEWMTENDTGQAPLARLRAFPHRSLTREGFVWFIGGTSAFLALPLLAVLGSPVLWGLLPFFAAAVAGVWMAINRNQRDTSITEELTLWRDRIELIRHNPRGPRQEWRANPFWVSLHLAREGGPVENYLTLKGDGREVELGAFLSPEERAALHERLSVTLARAKSAP